MGDAPDQDTRRRMMREHYPDAMEALAAAVGADVDDITIRDRNHEKCQANVRGDPTTVIEDFSGGYATPGDFIMERDEQFQTVRDGFDVDPEQVLVTLHSREHALVRVNGIEQPTDD